MIFNTVGPAYRVHTQRLVIRCWQPEDAPLLKASIDENLEHLRPQMPWAMNEPTDLQAKIGSNGTRLIQRHKRNRARIKICNTSAKYGII